jgi:hypothetical protein
VARQIFRRSFSAKAFSPDRITPGRGGGNAVTIRVPPPTHSTARPHRIFQPDAWPQFSKKNFNPQSPPLPFQNDYPTPESRVGSTLTSKEWRGDGLLESAGYGREAYLFMKAKRVRVKIAKPERVSSRTLFKDTSVYDPQVRGQKRNGNSLVTFIITDPFDRGYHNSTMENVAARTGVEPAYQPPEPFVIGGWL